MFDMFNPAGFLTGPAEITEFDPANGKAVMEVPDCAWHICAAAESLPGIRVAVLVVLGAFLGVLEDLVGLGGLAKLLGGPGVIGVLVRMELDGQLAVGALDIARPGVPVHAQHLVVVPLPRHGFS